jgi:hypothetical protein
MRLRRLRLWVALLSVEYPECWVVFLSVLAWAILLKLALGESAGPMCSMHDGIYRAPIASSTIFDGRVVTFCQHFGTFIVHWLPMLLAMMVPPLLGSLRLVAGRSLWSRRHRAMALVLIGYVMLWTVFGLGSELLRQAIPSRFERGSLAGSFLLAALWQLTSLKRRHLIQCHRDPILAPSGWRADGACLRYGCVLAARCGLSCWALMAACTASGHAFWTAVLITSVVWAERFRPALSPRYSSGALVTGALLVCTGYLA